MIVLKNIQKLLKEKPGNSFTFSSNVVLLKAYKREQEGQATSKFTFQCGSIKSSLLDAVPFIILTFTFQCGSIKREDRKENCHSTCEFTFQCGSIKSACPSLPCTPYVPW